MTPSKNSLAYDLQEPFRFLVDLAVISLVESGAMETKDFIRTENYNLRLKPTGARKIVNEPIPKPTIVSKLISIRTNFLISSSNNNFKIEFKEAIFEFWDQLNEFSNTLNKKVSYQGKESTWSYVIFLKVRELAHYLTSKKRT